MGKFAWEVEALPTSEYFGWIAFFEREASKAEGKSGNLLSMGDEDMIGALTGD